ncbi:MAG: ATP-binding protein [Lachnospiraceae bacterium]|nr:ATP-binding protein [Lachnospiraceae bacterium]
MHDLLVQDNSISEMQRQKLNKAYPCKTEKAQAEYLTDLLLFGMERNFVKRETRTKELLAVGNRSPMVADYIYENEVPKPCRYFCGRDSELDALHILLTDEGKVFLHGIAGIGKSELAKAYAKLYRKNTPISFTLYTAAI